MKIALKTALVLLCFCLALQSADAQGHSRKDKLTEDKLDGRKETYEGTYQLPFPDVWNIIKESINEIGCQIESAKPITTDEGTYKGKIQSTFCILVRSDDTTDVVLERYAMEVPYIRAGVWTSGRMQYTFYVVEKDNGDVNVRLKGELSGYEDHVTSKFHYFESNRILEEKLYNIIEGKIAAMMEESDG